MIKWLLTAAAALLLLSSTVSAVAVGNETVSSSTTTNSLHHHHRRTNSNHQLKPEPKNLNIINDRFEAIAQFTHSQLSKIPSNDDKDFDLQLAQTSLGKRPTPMPTPIKDLEQFQLNTDTPTSTTDWPTFSPSLSPVMTFKATSDSPSLMPTTSNPTPSPSIEPTTSAPTISPSTQEPSSFPVTPLTSSSPSSVDNGEGDVNDTVDIEEEDNCATLTVKKCKKMKDVCEVIDDASCKSINGAILNDTSYPTFYPTSSWPTYTPTDVDGILSSAPTLSILDAEAVTSHLQVNNEEDESYFPTYSPSEVSTKSTSGLSSNNTSISSNSITSNHGRVCPQEFNISIEYKGGDVVSIKRSRQCRAKRCHVEYQCKHWPESAYCNLLVPGKRGSDKGWLKLGRCFDASGVNDVSLNNTVAEVEEQGQGNGREDAASSPTGESTTGQESSHHEENEDGSLPTPSPLAHDQASSSHQDNEDSDIQSVLDETTDTQQAGTPDIDESIRVPLPRIIADITLSSSLSEEFEQKHILSEAMTNMIYNLFGIYIYPSLYDLVGISLSVDIKKNSNEVGDAETTRVHAYFDGDALFSMIGAPAKSDLITLLVQYFDIDEFNQRLVTSVGGRRRLSSADEEDSVVVKVNSVFFTLEDGSLVSAGAIDWEEDKLPPPSTTLERDNQLQVAFVLSALLGLACMSALIMFGIYYKRMKDEDEEELGAFPSALPSTLPSAPRIGAAPMPISSETSLNLEEGSRVSEPLDTISEVAINTSTESGVHIQIPATPDQAVSDLSQFASDGSEVSSFSYSPSNAAMGSPAHGLGFVSSPDTPASLGLGTTKNRRVAGSPSDLRVMSWAGDVGLGLKKYDPSNYHWHWEIYQQDSTMESV